MTVLIFAICLLLALSGSLPAGEPDKKCSVETLLKLIEKEKDERPFKALLYSSLAERYEALGDTAQAEAAYIEAERIYRKYLPRTEKELSGVLCDHAFFLGNIGLYSRQARVLEEAIHLARQSGDKTGEVLLLENLISCLSATGEHARKADVMERKLSLLAETKGERSEEYISELRALLKHYVIYPRKGKDPLFYCEKLLHLCETERKEVCDIYSDLYREKARVGNILEADILEKKLFELAEEEVARAQQENDGRKIFQALSLLETCYERRGEHPAIRDVLKKKLQILGDERSPLYVRTLVRLAMEEAFLGNRKEAGDSFRKAINILEKYHRQEKKLLSSTCEFFAFFLESEGRIVEADVYRRLSSRAGTGDGSLTENR